MYVLMMIVAGMAVALAIYYLLMGVFSFELQMEKSTVNYFGLLPTVFVFAMCGSILVLKVAFEHKLANARDHALKGRVGITVLALFWSAVLGFVATHSLGAVVAPILASV